MLKLIPGSNLETTLGEQLDLLAGALDTIAGAVCDLGDAERALLCRRLARIQADVSMVVVELQRDEERQEPNLSH